jgi:hypothetical protein
MEARDSDFVLKVVVGDSELFDDIPDSELDDQRMMMQAI